METSPNFVPLPRWAQRLRRVTTSGKYLPEVDGLRFLAIAWVVALHVQGYVHAEMRHAPSLVSDAISWVLFQGHLGVPLFFSISGFILAVPFAEHYLNGGEPVRLRAYFLRRLTRLEPPYIVVMLGLFLLHVVRGHRDLGELLPHLGASLAYLHNAIYGEWNFLNTVTWSLEVEVQFYLLAPLLAHVFKLPTRWRRAVLIAAILGFAVAEPDCWLALGIRRPDFFLIGQLHHFLVGFLLADLHLSGRLQERMDSSRWDAVALVMMLAIPVFYAMGGVGKLGFPIAVLALYCAAFYGGVTRAVLRQPVIATFGGMCYSIYLIHLPLIYVVMGVTKRFCHSDNHLLNLVVQSAFVLPIILVVSTLFYALIERPCMNKHWPKELAGWLSARLKRTA